MYKISVDEALNEKDVLFVDMRSPKEYSEAHIPGAINIPLFDNLEREKVGIHFHDKGSNEAIKLGIEIISKKLPGLIETFSPHKKKKLIIYCFRGGMRSKSIVNILDIFGFNVRQLTGGHKAFRKHVLESFKKLEFKPKLLGLYGLTGAGKTELLHKLKEEGYPLIDLEGLAGHRSSLLGKVNLIPKSQKMFDALLLVEIDKLKNEKVVFIEGEAKKVGAVQIPDSFYECLKNSIKIDVLDSKENRIKRLVDEYTPLSDKDTEYIFSVLDFLKQRLSKTVVEDLKEKLTLKDYDGFTDLMLEHYYDPLYKRTLAMNKYDNSIDQRDEPIKNLIKIFELLK